MATSHDIACLYKLTLVCDLYSSIQFYPSNYIGVILNLVAMSLVIKKNVFEGVVSSKYYRYC